MMADDDKDSKPAATETPSRGTKRGHSDNDEELSPRRVAARTDNGKEQDTVAIQKFRLKSLKSSSNEVIMHALDHIIIVLGNDDEEDEKAFASVGVPEHIVRIMKENIHSRDIEEKVLGVLVRSSFDCEEIQAALVEAGAIEALLSLMTHYYTERSFVITGIQILYNLCNLKANAERFVISIGGVPIITHIMLDIPMRDDFTVIFEACRLLNLLCHYDQLRGHLLDAHVASCLSIAMKRNQESNFIQRFASAALNQLEGDHH